MNLWRYAYHLFDVDDEFMNICIVSILIPAEYMLNNSDRSVLSKSHFMIKCLLSYKVSFKFKKIEFTKKEIFKM